MTVALWGWIWKTLEYVLPSACLTRDQCQHILATTLMVALSRMGICRYAKRKPLYLPLKYFGLGLHSLHMLQVTLQLQMIHRHWRESTVTRKLLRQSFEHWLMCLGICNPFLLSSALHKVLVPSNWWTALVSSVQEYDLDLQLVLGLEANLSIPSAYFLTNQAAAILSHAKMILFNWC